MKKFKDLFSLLRMVYDYIERTEIDNNIEKKKLLSILSEYNIDYLISELEDDNSYVCEIIADEEEKQNLLEFLSYMHFNENEKTHLLLSSLTNTNWESLPKNLLLKGVPGTGKSRFIEQKVDEVFEKEPELKERNILHINIHSASSNSDLMQGISVSTKNNQVEYNEKKGLILQHIEKAIYTPNQPFFIILEEIQENSLNELIGDAIYLIEETKRAKYKKGSHTDKEEVSLETIIEDGYSDAHKVKVPNLIEAGTTKDFIIPENIYFYCTSNYRNDKKVIEDNLLRRFDVIEMYPDENVIKDTNVGLFLSELNDSIEKVITEEQETHPDRFLIGHANFINVTDKKSFAKALLKTFIDFKEIKEIEFEIVKKIFNKDINIPFNMNLNMKKEDCSYHSVIKQLQEKSYAGFFYKEEN